VYRKALDIDPKDADAFEGLALSLTPDDDLSDLQRRFAKLDDHQETFDNLASQLWQKRNGEVLEQVALAMRKADFQYPAVDHYLALVQAQAGKTEEAIQSFRRMMQREKNVELKKVNVTQFLRAMADNGKSTEAYEAAPDAEEAFRTLATQLRTAHSLDALRRLLAAHRKKRPNDVLLPFFQGTAHIHEGQYRLAEEAFALGMKAPPDRDTLAPFNYHRILARYHTGAGLTAYNEIGERRQTFYQLAWLYLGEKNYAQLSALIDTHARNDPGSRDEIDFRLRVHIHQGRFADAVALFRKELPTRDREDERGGFASTFLLEMASAGKVIEGYDAMLDGKRAFRLLMDERDDQGATFDVDKLIAHHREKHPDDVWLHYWTGTRYAEQRAWDEAARSLERVMKHGDRRLQDRARWSHVRASYHTLGALRAYRECGEPNEVYPILANLLINERRGAELEELIRLHQPRAGDDAEVVMHALQARLLQKKPDEAVTLFREAYQKQAYGPRRQGLVTTFVSGMASMGKSMEAYRASPDREAAFQALAQDWVAQKKPEQLAHLLDEHANSHGDTPMHAFYKGELHLLRGEAEQAERYFASALDRVSWQTGWMYRGGLFRAGVKAGRAVTLYQERRPGRETFDWLARVCLEEKDAAQLEGLIGAHRKRDPEDPGLGAWEVDLLWLNKDYEGVMKFLADHPRVFTLPRFRWKADERRVRCLVKLKRHDEAQAELVKLSRQDRELMSRDEEQTLLRILVSAARGDVKATIAILETLPDEPSMRSRCYSDDDLGPILRGEAFRKFREQFPEPKE
jgi:tetratricopeptide (TPR) repeat protein